MNFTVDVIIYNSDQGSIVNLYDFTRINFLSTMKFGWSWTWGLFSSTYDWLNEVLMLNEVYLCFVSYFFKPWVKHLFLYFQSPSVQLFLCLKHDHLLALFLPFFAFQILLHVVFPVFNCTLLFIFWIFWMKFFSILFDVCLIIMFRYGCLSFFCDIAEKLSNFCFWTKNKRHNW